MLNRAILILSALLLFANGAPAAYKGCARMSKDSERWIRDSVDELVRSAHNAYVEDEQESYDDVLGAVARSVKRCRLDGDADLSARYREFFGYVAEGSLATLPGHDLGFNVPDKQYFAETLRYLEIPDFLLDRTFVRNVSRYETLPKAKKYLEGLNATRDTDSQLIFFSYLSRHLGTPDNNDSYRRLLIIVPGDAANGIPDKWVQFGVTDPGVRVRTRNVSVVSALPAGDGTYNAYFKDYYRTYRRDGTIPIKGRLELGEGDENCAQCHKSGVLPIFPKKGSEPADELARVDDANARFRSYGAPSFGGYLDASKLGPSLSDAHHADRAARYGASFLETNVANAMRCDSCHTAQKLGYLNWPMDRIIVDSFVKHGGMPRGSDLSVTERRELYDKLIEEYFSASDARPGILKQYLLGMRNESEPPASVGGQFGY